MYYTLSLGETAFTLQELEECGSNGNDAVRMLLDKLKEEGLETHPDSGVVLPAEQLVQQLSDHPATVAQGELCTTGVLHGVQNDHPDNSVTMFPDSTAANDSTSTQYVKFAATAVAEWMSTTGIGTVKVQASGDILQAGSILARMVPIHTPESDNMSQVCSPGSKVWAWEVLWSGSGEDVPGLLALQEALSRVGRDVVSW